MSEEIESPTPAATGPVRIAGDLHRVLRIKSAHTRTPMVTLLDEILRPALTADALALGCPLTEVAAR